MTKLNKKIINNFSHILLQFGISIIKFVQYSHTKMLKTNIKNNQIQYQTMAFLTHCHYL